MLKNQAIFFSFVLIFMAGCSGTRPATKKGMPEWYLNPPKFEDRFVGVGQAQKQSVSIAKNIATKRAMAEISSQIESKITQIIKDFMSQSGIGEGAEVLEFTEIVTKTTSQNVLKGIVVDRTDVMNGTVFVMVTYDASTAAQAAMKTTRDAAKRETALYNEFNAQNAFDAMDREFQNMDTSSSN